MTSDEQPPQSASPGSDKETPSLASGLVAKAAMGLVAVVALVVLWVLISAWRERTSAKGEYEREQAAVATLATGPFLMEHKEITFGDRFAQYYPDDWKRRVHSLAVDPTADLAFGEGEPRRQLFAAMGSLQRLEYLALDGTDFSDADAEPVGGASALATILARNTRLGDRGVAWLARSPALRTLHLAGTPVTPAVGRSLQEASGLRHLNLSDTAVDDSTLADLARLRELSILDLSRTKVRGEGCGVLADHAALRMLLLAGSPIDDTAADALGKIASLKTLDLSHTRITRRALPPLLRLPRLEYLTLVGIDWRDGDMEIFAELPETRKLKVVVSRGFHGEPTYEAWRAFRRSFPQIELEVQ